MEENRIPKRLLYMNLGTTSLRGRPRNTWKDEVREDGKIVGGEGWQEKVHDRDEWKKLLRMATSTGNRSVENQSENIRKEATMAYLKYYFSNCLEGFRKTTRGKQCNTLKPKKSCSQLKARTNLLQNTGQTFSYTALACTSLL